MNGKITGIGAHVHDTLITLSRFPVEDTKTYVESVSQSGGGPCATALVAAARLGAETSWLGVLSDDAGGKFLMEDCRKYNVGTQFICVKPGLRSFSSMVLLNSLTHSRTCLLDRGTLPPLELNDDMRREIADAAILLIDGNEMTAAMEAVQVAKDNGTKVLYDAGGLYPGVERLMPYVDLLVPSEEFAIGFTKANSAEEAAQRLFEEYRPEIVAVTQGDQGGVFYDGRPGSWPAFRVDSVDTNGAGDVFHGAFAWATLSGYDHRDRCIFASAVSAIKCTVLGARGGLPDAEETKRFIRERIHHEL